MTAAGELPLGRDLRDDWRADRVPSGLQDQGAAMATTPPSNIFGPAKARRKPAPVKRITVSTEAKKAYEEQLREREKREKELGQFLPDDMKRR